MSDFWTGGQAQVEEDPEKKKARSFWENENTMAPSKPDFWGAPLGTELSAAVSPTLKEAQEKALWPSLQEVMHEAMVGAAMTGARLGQAMGAIIPEAPGIKEYYDQQLQAWNDAPAQTVGGDLVRNIARFTSADVPIQMMLGPLGMSSAVGRLVLGPAAADLVAFSGDEKRLSNTLAELGDDGVNNTIFDYLAADREDGLAEQKLKQGMEGILMNAAIAPLGHLIGVAYRGAKGLANKIDGSRLGNVANVVPDTSQVTGDADAVANYMLNMWHAKAKVNGKTVPIRTQIADSFVGYDRSGINPAYMSASGPISDENAFASEYWKRLQSVPGIEAFTPNDLAAKRDQFMNRLLKNEKPTTRTQGEVILDALDNNQKQLESVYNRTLTQQVSDVKRAFVSNWIDSAGSLKKHLLDTSGLDGRKAVDLYNLNRGAAIKGQIYSETAIKSVYQDIDQSDVPELSKIIMLRRDAAIKARDPQYSLPQDFGNGVMGSKIKAEDIAKAMRLHRTQLGADRWDNLNQRADAFFGRVRDAVDVLEASGVISLEQAGKLKKFDHAPVEFIDKYLDPVQHIELPGHGMTTVRGSGIPFLASGDSKRLIENDPQVFLEQIIMRAHTRAMRNESAQAMLKVAENGTSDIVTLNRPRGLEGDFTQLTAMVDGEARPFYIRKDYVNEWQTNPHAMDGLDRAISKWSGTGLLKTLKTGANPAAIVKLFPRDLMYAWLSAGEGKLYSANPLKFMNDISADLGTVKSDAWNRTGRFNEFIDEGGGMYLMTHQGQVYKPDMLVKPTTKLGKAWEKFEHVAGYLNETAEIAVRLAVREKAIRELSAGGVVTPEIKKKATAVAREYMDYSQGGLMSKRVDALIPYYNASVIGLAGIGRAAMADPKKMTQKLGMLMAGWTGLWMMNHQVLGPEQADMSPYDRANNFAIALPTYTVDEQGNKRHYYAKLPIDQSVAPLKAFVDATLDKLVYGKDATDEGKQIISGIGSMLPDPTSIPLVAAIMRMNGLDTFMMEPIWKGDDNLPAGERSLDSTPRAAVDIGEFADISPENLSAAIGTWTGGNFFTDLMRNLYDATDGTASGHGMDNKNFEGFIRTVPGARALLGKTHPLNGIEAAMQDAMEPAAVARKQAMDQFDQVMNHDIRGGDLSRPLTSEQVGQLTKWVKSQAQKAPEYAGPMLDRLKMTVTIDKVFKAPTKPSPLVRPPAFWLKLGGEPADVRADLFLDEIERLQTMRTNAGSEKQKAAADAALRETKKIVAGLGGYDPKTSAQFMFRLGRMAQERKIRIQ